MNATIPAALLMLLLAGGWMLGRRRSRPFLRSTDTTAVANLNRAQIERLQALAPSAAEEVVRDWPPAEAGLGQNPAAELTGCAVFPSELALQPRERRRQLRQLHAWMIGSRVERLQALAIVRRSSRRDVLPLLRLGLRDPDPAVVAAAAAAMVRFRGRTAAERQASGNARAAGFRLQPVNASMPRPRNVFRTL